MNVTVLVDFVNDSVRTALEVADALGDRLWGVRLDTSERMVDRALWHETSEFSPTGVNPVLVERVRHALDSAGHERVRIVVSGGFDSAKIRRFEALGLAGRRLRGRILARARRDRLHRRRGARGRPGLREGRPPHPSQSLPRASRVGLMKPAPAAEVSGGSSARCLPLDCVALAILSGASPAGAQGGLGRPHDARGDRPASSAWRS